VDPGQLDQVLLNLAANAREAMPGGGRLRIATSQAVLLRPEGEGPGVIPPGRYAVLEVADTGSGIPPEALPRLFEPFFTTRPERGGTGLGLATVQGIVAQSGGHISVMSRLGEGTSFRIHLPRHEGAVDAPPWASTPPAAAGAVGMAPSPQPEAGPARGAELGAGDPPPDVPAQGKGPVLLVEDEAPMRRLAERLLQRAGFAVTAADCAESALGLLAAGEAPPPALLVSDVAMPGEDGLSLARTLRDRFPHLPVVLMSGYAEVTLGRDLDAEDVRLLPKPFAPAELLAAVESALLRPKRHSAGASADVY
jgi:two-component system cell cycle sensor histidine kinase/response regulator CckA